MPIVLVAVGFLFGVVMRRYDPIANLLLALSKFKGQFEITDIGSIRHKELKIHVCRCCPLAVLIQDRFPDAKRTDDVKEMAVILRLNLHTIQKITDAADNHTYKGLKPYPELRKQLEEVCL